MTKSCLYIKHNEVLHALDTDEFESDLRR